MVVAGGRVSPQVPPSRVASPGCHKSLLQEPGASRKEKTFFFLPHYFNDDDDDNNINNF